MKSNLYRGPYLTRAQSQKCTFICHWSIYLKGIAHRNWKGISCSRISICIDTLISYVLCIGKIPSYQHYRIHIHVFFFSLIKQHFRYTQRGVPIVAQQKQTRLVSMRTRVPSLASLSGLRIHHCCELWCSQAAAARIRPLAWELSYAQVRPYKDKIYTHIYICIHTHTHIYTYIYIHRGKEEKYTDPPILIAHRH